MKPAPDKDCPCGSGRPYARCCRAFHGGAPARDPEALMRSRYSAYALGLVEYILETTHPEGPPFREDRRAWTEEVSSFCRGTDFEDLEVLEAEIGEEEGFVRFRVQLRQAGRDASFEEWSRFLRHQGRWLYHSGELRSRRR